MTISALEPGNRPGSLRLDETGALKVVWIPPTASPTITSAFGSLSITNNETAIAATAGSSDKLLLDADYQQITGIWDAVPNGLNYLFTQAASHLVPQRTGIYRAEFWGTVSTSVSNTYVAVKYGKSGVLLPGRRPTAKVANANDRVNLSAHGYLSLTEGDILTLHVAASKSTDLFIEDCVFSFSEVLTGAIV